MAKLRIKKTSAKGHKWKKGHSCVSNPQSSKHRQAARLCFFQPSEGTSNLTREALNLHNKTNDTKTNTEEKDLDEDGLTLMERQMRELEVDEDDLKSGCGMTFNTFATSFTTCTVPAFEKLFRSFDSSSDQHTRMLAIHAAAQEYMRESGTKETATSYFCSLIISLEGIMDSEEDTVAALCLLSKVARRVSKEVLIAKFASFSRILSEVLTKYKDSENSRLLANALGSLSILLRAQEAREWKNESTLALFNTLMSYTVHPKPKIRKAAHYNTAAILSTTNATTPTTTTTTTTATTTTTHPAAVSAAEFCLHHLKQSTESGNAKTTLHTLVLLRQIIVAFPRKQLKTVCECLLSLLQISQPLVNMSALQALHALLASHPPAHTLPQPTNTALLHALTLGGAGVPVPGRNDPQLAVAWITVITVGLINCFRLNEEEGMAELLNWTRMVVTYWQSDHVSVQTKVSESIEVLLKECVSATSEDVRSGPTAGQIFECIASTLTLQYQPAWGCILRTFQTLFSILGPWQAGHTRLTLTTLCGFINSDTPHRGGVEGAIGAAVRTIGPEALVQITGPSASGVVAQDETTWWILPLFRKFVTGHLVTFVERLVPFASKCFEIVNSLEEKDKNGVLGRAYQQVERQVWGALPSFCKGASDIEQALSKEDFARLLCDHIKHRSDTRTFIMEALRHMISTSLQSESPYASRLGLYAKNYIPALFNVYLTAPGSDGVTVGQRQASFATIKSFVAIVRENRAGELLKMVLERHTQAGTLEGASGQLRRRALVNLASVLIPKLDVGTLGVLYTHITPLLKSSEHGQQKAGYRVLEEVLEAGTECSESFITGKISEIMTLLSSAQSTVAPSSRGPRLRCLRVVVLKLEPRMGLDLCRRVLREIIGEAVVCCGRPMSQATRKSAFLLISDLGTVLQTIEKCEGEETVLKALEILLAGLAGSTSLASATMLALTALTYQYKDHVTDRVLGVLVENACAQLLCKTREIVASCLSFLKACLAMFDTSALGLHLDVIMKGLTNMTEDCKRKYRLKTRDILDRLIRKFGFKYVADLVPADDLILHKRLKNLRKLAARKERDRAERRNSRGDEGSEDEEGVSRALPASLDEILAEIEDSDDETKGEVRRRKRKQGQTRIKEDSDDIFDFLDPSAGQAIVRGEGKKARGEGGFQIEEETGKIIITDEREEEEQESEERKMDLGEMTEFLNLKSASGGSGKVKRKRSAAEVADETQVAKRKKHDPGSEFRSKKAGGDVGRKKGRGGSSIQPYAYVRLSKEQLNRRKKAKFEGQFGSLVKGARRGVLGGRKRGGKGRVAGGSRK